MTNRQRYVSRINRVIDHIDAHLADPLDLDALAAVANFSPFHFHRIFHAMTGETLAERVRRRRLEVAAARLLTTPPTPALTIALGLGFNGAETFSRSFKAHFGVSPTAWRRGASHGWFERQRAQLGKIHQADRKHHQAIDQGFGDDRLAWPSSHDEPPKGAAMNVDIRNIPETRVAYLRHIGPYGTAGIPRTWARLATWCGAHGLMQPRRTMVGIGYDNPDVTPPDKCRYDACVEVDASFKPDGEIGSQTIGGGRYLCAPFTGTTATIHEGWMALCGEALAESGYQADDRPTLEIYPPDFEMDEKTGVFSCLLCMPVRPL